VPAARGEQKREDFVRHRTESFLALAAFTLAISLQANGVATAQQTYPTRTVQLVLPYGAASATDIAARLFADRLSKLWGKPVIVENRPGGDGIVSLNSVRAAHDDHTLWMGPAGVINVLPYKHDTLPFDIKREFVPIVSVVNVALAISTASSMKIDAADQLIKLIKEDPGKLNGAASNGISEFLLFGFLKQKGLQVAQVPYRDIMQAPNDLVGGAHSVARNLNCGGAAARRGGPNQSAPCDQQQAGAKYAQRANRGRGRLSRPYFRQSRRSIRAGGNAAKRAGEHCG
jgi:tripartite-type tricarboxylate transporter receptor subunit TctC